jgi:kynurenine 3-monooxygenase
LLLSNEDSADNVVKLRKLLNDKSGKEVGDLFDDCELKRYFSRRSFRGAVIDCNRLHEGEWIVLLGDAAHSVLPPVGEGINSGLEDTVILSSIINNTTHPFNHYNTVRMPDIIALSQIAHYLNTSNKSYPPEKISRLIFIIL